MLNDKPIETHDYSWSTVATLAAMELRDPLLYWMVPLLSAPKALHSGHAPTVDPIQGAQAL